MPAEHTIITSQRSEAPAVTLGRMRAMSPSLGASSVTILVAVLGISTASVKADFLDRNFLDNLFSFSGSQSADYPRLVITILYLYNVNIVPT